MTPFAATGDACLARGKRIGHGSVDSRPLMTPDAVLCTQSSHIQLTASIVQRAHRQIVQSGLQVPSYGGVAPY